jgi:outer membrane protein
MKAMSFSRRIGAALLGLLIIAGPALAQDGPPTGTTVVYLRSAQIVQNAPGSTEAQRTFERELGEARTELQQQAAVVDSMMQDYQRQEVLLSPQAKTQKEQEIRDLQTELANRQRELDTSLQQRQQDLLQPILDRVAGVIEQIRTERGYSIVLDASTEGVVAADTTLDITALVMSELGQDVAVPPTPAPAPDSQ